MTKRILIALALVAFMALPASAAVQNVKVSGSIDNTWLVRDNFNLGVPFTEFYQNLLITQAILRVDADLTDNVSTALELINERPWGDTRNISGTEGAAADLNSNVQINLAYVTLREMLYSPLTITIGRQILRYGDGLIIGDYDTNNATAGNLRTVADDLSKRKAFDAIKAVLNYDPLVIDIFAAKVDENQVLGAPTAASGNSKDDVDLYGINANWKLGDKYNSAVEGYFFARINKDGLENATVGSKADTTYVPGLRAQSNPIKGLYSSAEIAWQKGTTTALAGAANDNIQRDAMAVQTIGSYALPFKKTEKYSPVIIGSYTWTTGDSNPTNLKSVNQASSNKNTAWDPMYEDNASGTIFNSLFALSNSHTYQTAFQVKPLEDVTAKLTFWSIWLDKEFDKASTADGTDRAFARSTPDGAGITYIVAPEETHLGNEIDFDLTYDYTEDVKIGISSGWFIPGEVFTENNSQVAKQFLTSVKVNF